VRILPSLSRGLRLALILGLSTTYIAWHTRDAFAKKHSSDDDSGDDDDEDDGTDDSGGKGGDDSDDSNDDNGDDSDADKDQPAVTAGGLYTIKSYPVRELERPLTMTKGITQLHIGVGTDISAKGAFDTAGVNLDAAYGLKDNFTVLGGIDSAYNFRSFDFYFGFEGALVYDLFDIRVAADLHRSAIPHYSYFCEPVTANDMVDQKMPDPAQCGDQDPNNPAQIVSLPDGNYNAGDMQFSIDLGFPFRYSFTPQIAIVALQSLIKIDFNGVGRDHVLPEQVQLFDAMGQPLMDSMGNNVYVTNYVPAGNSAKPDLTPSIGFALNPIPQLSVVAYAQLIVPDFDTHAGAFQVPVSLRIEASPQQKLDIGLQFTLLNVDPPDPQSPVDNRFLSAYMQARF
jgi:hypothetical protein